MAQLTSDGGAMQVRTQFREVFLELGFEEMPTDRFVESSFWSPLPPPPPPGACRHPSHLGVAK